MAFMAVVSLPLAKGAAGHERHAVSSGFQLFHFLHFLGLSRPPSSQVARLRRRGGALARRAPRLVRDAKLRDEALRSAKSACLNCAEGAGRVTRGDKARAFAVARAEATEAAAAVEIAALCGEASAESTAEVARLASRVVAMLTPLVR